MKYLIKHTLLCSLCLLSVSIPIHAADAPEQGKPELKIVNMTVSPAAIPRPAMKYRLLPRLADQKPGNAALLYDTIFIRIAEEDGIREGRTKDLKEEKEREKFSTNADKLSNWLATPLDKLPKDEVRKILDDVQPWIMEYAEAASRRTDCNWDLPVSELENPFEMHLPELHRARSLARIIAMKARLAIAEGKPEEALKTLQIGFSLSRHVGNGNVTIIHLLVGNVISNMMREQLADLVQLYDAPNLYWSLSNLPRPFQDYHYAVEGENAAFGYYFCELQEAKKADHSPEHWQALLQLSIDKLTYTMAVLDNQDPRNAKNEVDLKKILEENYPVARDYLIKFGWPEKEIRSMAPSRVLLLYGGEMWSEMSDDAAKWLGIDYSQWPDDVREHFDSVLKKYGDFPLAKSFGVMGKIAAVRARTERDFDSLRCIEAIRLYAHSHEGKLPAGLSDIKEVPIPPNPMTGKPFAYRVENDTAVLTADGDLQTNYEYRIKIAK